MPGRAFEPRGKGRGAHAAMGRGGGGSHLAGGGGRGDRGLPRLEGGVACAIHEDPSRDPQPPRDLGEAGVERLRLRLKQESCEEALAETMAGDLRLAGDLFTYEDAGNADIIS